LGFGLLVGASLVGTLLSMYVFYPDSALVAWAKNPESQPFTEWNCGDVVLPHKNISFGESACSFTPGRPCCEWAYEECAENDRFCWSMAFTYEPSFKQDCGRRLELYEKNK